MNSEKYNSAIEIINGYFDKIFVLSLPHAKDRQQNIEKVLDGLNWEFFWGTDKKQFTQESVQQDGVYDDKAHKNTKRTTRSMNLGEVACSISHRRMYQQMLDNNYQRILILEDDVLPVKKELENFPEIVSELPADWELLMLGYYGHKLPTPQYRMQQQVYRMFHHLKLFNWHKVNKNWIDNICMQTHSENLWKIGKVLGTHGYAVTQSAAKKFIDYQTPVKLQADRIFNYYMAEYGLNGYALKNPMLTLSELANTSYIQ